jgi:hypothetical protein
LNFHPEKGGFMRALAIILLSLWSSQPVWALLSAISQQTPSEQSTEVKKTPPPEKKKEEAKNTQDEAKNPPVDPDNPGGPPVADNSESLPTAASPIPLVAIVGLSSLAAAFILRIWRRWTESGTTGSRSQS